jgi:nucleoside-diphosphate-sugar epimerase
MPQSPPATVLIAGAGDLGLRVAQRRALRGDAVLALRRRAAALEGVHRNLRPVAADVIGGHGFAALPRQVDALVFCAAPDRREEAAYRALFVDGLQRVLDAVQASRIVLVSSTAVYGEDAGEWIDEATPPRPAAFNGRVLLEAEARVHAAGGSALRLSGLYGRGRTMLLRRAREGVPGRRHWTNRIHLDDAAAALDALLDRDRLDPTYCASDDTPALERDVLDWLREREGLPTVPPHDGPQTGRRVSNARLRGTGWAPHHPDWRSGYTPLLERRD